MTRRFIRLTAVAGAGLALTLLLPASASAQTAQARYTAAKAREDKVRAAIKSTPPGAPVAARSAVITESRSIIAAYEALVRAYRASGYADNALFNAASLADALHDQYGLTTDRDAALRLYKRLRAEYPTAPLARQTPPLIARLEQIAEAKAPVAPPMTVPATPAPIVGATAASSGAAPSSGSAAAQTTAKLLGIERTVLPDLVRVTLSLDREVRFHEESLTGPARVFFDLPNVEAAPELVDATLRYQSEIVRQIRVGRHPNAIRVVLDFEEVGRHSTYTLYNPFRIVVDAEPPPGRAAKAAPSSGEPTPATTAPPPVNVAPPAKIADPAPVVPSVIPAVERPAEPVSAPADAGSETAAPPATPPSPRSASVPAVPAAPPVAPRGNTAGGFSIARQLGLGVSRIVIDPGHGGRDPGALVRGLSEAALTLDIALRLEKLLQKEPGLEVILTRRTDVYVPLEERTAIANREGADLFLSIHANTSRNTAASGVETYFLSFAGSPEAEAVAARENASSAGEMHRLPDIVKAITLNNKLDESRDFAAMVQEALVTRLQRSNRTLTNRGVKKAPFVVLIGAEMPSVLAEVSFMSNARDLQLLRTAAYKQRIAEALHAAVMRYRRSLKGAATASAQ